MLHFPDPAKLKAKRVVFEEIYTTPDAGTLEQLKELSSRRRELEESINESSFITEAIAREISGGLTSRYEQDLQKLERYLPLLENLLFHVLLVGEDARLAWTSNLSIKWSSVLSSSQAFNLTGTKFFCSNDLHFELVMILFLYGGILRERAIEILSTDVVQSAALFRKAAGVYHHLHQLLISIELAFARERPPEATSSISSIMILICLAEAQAVTSVRAEEKGSSSSLLAKLHYGIKQFLDEGTTILHTLTKECRNISPRLMEFINSCMVLHELRSEKHLANGLKLDDRIGTAVGVLRRALKNVKNKAQGNDNLWRGVIKQEIDGVSEILRKLEHENELVWCQKVPKSDELPSLEGKKIVSPIPYCPQSCARKLVLRV